MIKFKKYSITKQQFFNPTNENYDTERCFKGTTQLIPWKREQRIEWFTIPRNESRARILFFCPGGGNFTRAIPFLNTLSQKTQSTVYGFNYPGYGLSDGEVSINSLRESSRWAMDYINRSTDANLPLILFGYSIGNFAMLDALGKNSSDTAGMCILAAPHSSAEDIINELLKQKCPALLRPFIKVFYDPFFGNVKILNNLEAASKVKCRTLVAAGKNDMFIPQEFSLKVYEQISAKEKKYLTVPEAGHNDLLEQNFFTDQVSLEIRDFIAAHSNSRQTDRKNGEKSLKESFKDPLRTL